MKNNEKLGQRKR